MKLRKLVSMREALESPGYFGSLLSGASWQPWRVFLIAIVGEELTADERIIFTALTGREREPLEPVEEFWGGHWASRRENPFHERPSRIYRGMRRSP